MSQIERGKPLLIGEQNPYGNDPYFALYPSPEGCSGHRLCALVLGMHRSAYLEAFDRANLCDGPWDAKVARKHAGELWVDARKNDRPALILLGQKVARAFALPGHRPMEPFSIETNCTSTVVLALPHPSGLCRLWNEPGAFARARVLVAEVCPKLAHLLGAAYNPPQQDYEEGE